MAKKIKEEKKEVVVENKGNATIARVHPSGRMVFVKMEGTERERPVPVVRLTPKKDEYKVGDKVTVDVPPMRGAGNPLSEDRLKEIEERRVSMRAEMESRRAEVLKMRDERRKGLQR